MGERRGNPEIRKSKLNMEFGIPEISLPEKETVEPQMPGQGVASATIPEGENYTKSAQASGTMSGTPKIFSGGRMVVDRSAKKNDDIEARVKDVLTDGRLNQIVKDDDWADVKSQVDKGATPITLDANEAHDHISEHHDIIKSFLGKLPENILKKADAHDSAAKAIERIQKNHPEAAKQRDMAAKLRGFVGMPDNITNVHTMRAAKDAVLNGGGTLDNNRDYQLNVQNKLVTALTKFKLLKRGGDTFVTDSPSVNHPALQASHQDLININNSINKLLKPLGMSSPISTHKLSVFNTSIGQMQTAKTSINPQEYRDTHPETGELSKAGHIWGEKPGLGITEETKDVKLFPAKDYREREQIPLTDEGKAYIKKTYGTKHPVMSRFNSAKAALNIKNVKTDKLRNSKYSPEDFISPEDERDDELKDTLLMGQYSKKNRVKSDTAQPAKFVDQSVTGTTNRAARDAAMEGADIARGERELTQHHVSQSFEALIAGNQVPLASANYLRAHPDYEKLKSLVEKKAGAHIQAVADFKANKRPNQSIRKILGSAGLTRAEKQAGE